jgi:phosphatidylglycerophosphatase A
MGAATFPSFEDLRRRPLHMLAFGFGAGLSPSAPGTAGTLLAVPLVLVLQNLAAGWYLLLTAGLFVLGVWLCGRTARDLQVHDHQGIVWDEIVGYLVAMAWAPKQWTWIISGFVLFRLFDIFKPWPIRTVDRRLRGGVGIMLDDLLAGLAAGLVLAGVERLHSGGLGWDF